MMPDMAGPDVAHRIKKHRPEMRVMLMSGYPDGEMLFLNYGWHFIEKPFLAAKLVERVNDILHTPERSQGEDHFDDRIDPKVQDRGQAVKIFQRRHPVAPGSIDRLPKLTYNS